MCKTLQGEYTPLKYCGIGIYQDFQVSFAFCLLRFYNSFFRALIEALDLVIEENTDILTAAEVRIGIHFKLRILENIDHFIVYKIFTL